MNNACAVRLLDNMCCAVTQDHSLKLWDMRMSADVLQVNSATNSALFPRTNPPAQDRSTVADNTTGRVGEPGCVAVFTGHTEPVTGFALHDGNVISYAGPHLGVLSLHGPPYSQSIVPTRLSNVRGGKDVAAIVGLDILPHSRLLVAGTEDGVIKICH